MTPHEKSEAHRAFVREVAKHSPQHAFAEADKMADTESVNAEKEEWRKLALWIQTAYLSK